VSTSREQPAEAVVPEAHPAFRASPPRPAPRPVRAPLGPMSTPVPEGADAYQELLERLPAVVYAESVTDGVTKPLYVSQQVEWVLGISVTDWLEDPGIWSRQLHPSDRRWVSDDYRRALTTGGTWTAEYRLVAADGHVVWVHDRADITRDASTGASTVQGALFDVTERKAIEATLRRRDAVLRAVGFAAERFLQAGSWIDSIDEVLARLGRSADVSRVYLFRNRVGERGELLMDELFEWAAPGISPTIDDPEKQGFPYLPHYQHYLDILGSGGVIAGVQSDFSGFDRSDLASEEVLAAAFVPIFASGDWWGYLGFDECVTERRWSSSELDALKAAAGTLGAVIGREESEDARIEAERRYRTLVEQIPAITYADVVDDPDATSYPTVYISPQVEAILGYTPEEWMAHDDLWDDLLHPEDRDRMIDEDEEKNREGLPYVGEYRLIARDGRVVWIRDEARVLEGTEGDSKFWHGVMLDVTEMKEAQLALSDALEREQAHTERLQALNETKNTLLHAVSHDLRNPLTAIMGAASTLERAGDSLSADDSEALLHGLGTNARKMARLIRDLLDLDRLDRGVVEPDRGPADLTEIARRAVAECEVLEGRIVHVAGDPLVLAVDAGQVERIVENLLLNAARHTAAGTPVWVRIRPEGGGALLCVDDAGPGVPEEIRETIFEPFRQGTTMTGVGVGIGLSLVSHFARLHRGSAWVEERAGGGASFRVFLPEVDPDAVPDIDAPE
jgi:PAS domain S-box-containing protein